MHSWQTPPLHQTAREHQFLRGNSLPKEADVTLGRSKYSSLQLCSTSRERPHGRADKVKPLLLSPSIKKFGTSADEKDIDAVELVNNVHYEGSICGPLMEIGVYKGWFVAALVSIAVRNIRTNLN